MFEHLLVVIDPRAGACRAVALGLRLASCLGARVTVLFVVATPTAGAPFSAPTPSRKAINTGERLFRHIRRMAKATGVSCACRFAFGRDAHMIVREAAVADGCDLILVNAPRLMPSGHDAAY